MVNELIIGDGICKDVITETKAAYYDEKVVITTCTCMRGKVLTGDLEYESGPNNQRVSIKLSEDLEKHGFDLIRFKTGTPPRVNSNSSDYSKTEIQPGDEHPKSFSYDMTDQTTEQIHFWSTDQYIISHLAINDILS